MRIEKKLKEEHDSAEKKLKKIIQSDSINEKSKLFLEVKEAVLTHIEAEEKVLYSRLRSESDSEDVTDEINESKQEHHVAKLLIRELEKTKISSPEWEAKIKVLLENLEHHHREEEEEQLQESRELFDNAEANQMCEEFEELKEKAS